MKRSAHLLRCATGIAAFVLAAGALVHGHAAFAQATPKDAPPAYPHAMSKKTTTSPDGLTTTTTTNAIGRYGNDIITTVVRTTDKDHIVQSEVTTTSDDGLSASTLRTVSKKYNLLGGYSETIDFTETFRKDYDSRETIYTDHEELQCDAAGNVVSGTLVKGGSYIIDKGPERAPLTPQKYTWDATAKTWTTSEKTSLTRAQPRTITADATTEQVIAPTVASPGKEMMVTYRDTAAGDSTTAGPVLQFSFRLEPTVTVPAVTDEMYFMNILRDYTGVDRWVAKVPADATSVTIFKGLDAAGKPDAHASVTTVSPDAAAPGLNLPHIPLGAGQPGIVASAGAYQVLSGMISVQTQNTSVADTLVLDTEQPLTTLAASDRSIVAALPSNISLGRHELSLEQLLAPQPVYADVVPFDAVSLTVDPMPPVENVGDTATPTVHVTGLVPGDVAVMEFAIGGSAELTAGGTFTTVPVIGNVASTTIIGVRSGEALVRFHLRMLSLAPLPPS